MISRILTGLSEREWKEAWGKLSHPAPGTHLADKDGEALIEATFEEWQEAVIAEGHNRRFISYAVTGKRCSLRAGVQAVINEILDPSVPTAADIVAAR